MHEKKHTSHLSKLIEMATLPLVEDLLPFFINQQTPIKMVENAKKELTETATGKAYRERIERAFKGIAKNIKHIASIHLCEEIANEWIKIPVQLESFFTFKDVAPGTNISKHSLQQTFGISDKTINLFYQCGSHAYEHHHYKEACDIFFLVTSLSPAHANAWIALGLCERKGHNIQEALLAFAMATLIDNSIAAPQVYSAESYAEQKNYEDALESLQLAKEIAQKNPEHNPPSLTPYINKLIHKYQTQ